MQARAPPWKKRKIDWSNSRFRFQECVRRAPNLTYLDKLVAIAVSSYMNVETGQCFPSEELLAMELGVTVRAIAGCIAKLRSHGWISSWRPGRNESNHYALLESHFEFVEDLYQNGKDDLRDEREMKRAARRKPL